MAKVEDLKSFRNKAVAKINWWWDKIRYDSLGGLTLIYDILK